MRRAIVLALLIIAALAPLAGSAHAEPSTDDIIEQSTTPLTQG